MTETFDYVRPHTIAEAVALLSDEHVRSRVWCGGTDIMVKLRTDPPDFARAIDVSQIADLHTIAVHADTRLRVGAAVTFREAATSPLIIAHAPLLAEACRSIGTMQIGNMATLGGNVANAAVAADTIPALVCLEADAVIATAAGEQRIPVGELITGPNRTCLPPGGLITAFEWALLPEQARSRFLKVGRRNALSIARLSMAVIAQQSPEGYTSGLRLVAGACFARPRRAAEIEAPLLGKLPTPALLDEAGQQMAALMVHETGVRWSTEYKALALAALVAETLEAVLDMKEVAYAI